MKIRNNARIFMVKMNATLRYL